MQLSHDDVLKDIQKLMLQAKRSPQSHLVDLTRLRFVLQGVKSPREGC